MGAEHFSAFVQRRRSRAFGYSETGVSPDPPHRRTLAGVANRPKSVEYPSPLLFFCE